MKLGIRNLSGIKIDMLTVYEMVEQDSNKHVRYRCVCDCGKECIRRADNLLAKTLNPHSCGCSVKQLKPSAKRIDMTGNRYDHLVVSKMLFNYNANGDTFCECVCDCGNVYIIGAKHLRNKSAYPKNCGCLRNQHRIEQANMARIDLTGKRFGRLVVKEMIYENNKQTLAKCICDCGNYITTKAVYLNNGDTKSCGCLQRDMASISNTKDYSGIRSAYGVEILSRAIQTKRGVWLWNCKCGECGGVFVALPAKILSGHATSCGCIRRSSGEKLIKELLDSLDVSYVQEKRFGDCIDVKPLPFDFYLPEYNTVIEFQGEQHFRQIDWFGDYAAFETRQQHDIIKKEYCISKGITFVEVFFNESADEIKSKITSIIYP